MNNSNHFVENVLTFFKGLRSLKVGPKRWFSDYVFDKTWLIGRWKINASMRRTNGWMGRFGGGWNWALGFKAGGRTLLINLLVMSISISRPKRRSEPE